jgi:hypothetical protein
MDIKKNRLAQDIDIDNNPVNKDIIPEDKNTDKDIKETTPTPTPVITEEEIKPIEQNNTVEETIEPVQEPSPEPVIETPQLAVKNTVRYIDSGFTF